MATRFPNQDWQMMNYGYHSAGKSTVEMKGKNKHQQYQLQMYHSLSEISGIKDKDVLEIGCGRGGGAYYLFSHLQPKNYHGIDIANKSIEFCKKNYHSANLQFTVANAENLPFSDKSFDVVINVESSHTYGSVSGFLAETFRVLKDNGHLLLADFRAPEKIELLINEMKDAGFKIIQHDDITENVIMALDSNSEIMNERINNSVPFYLRKFFREFAATKNSFFYNAFKYRKRVYHWFWLEKQDIL